LVQNFGVARRLERRDSIEKTSNSIKNLKLLSDFIEFGAKRLGKRSEKESDVHYIDGDVFLES
jgi:hypothetical protein